METFTCERHKGSLQLTALACGRLYQRAEAEEAKRLEPLGPCRGCAKGEQNARDHDVAKPKILRREYVDSLF